MFNAIIDYDHYDLMRSDSGFIEKFEVTLLYAFDGWFKHMFRLTVDTYADGQFDSSIFGPSK